MTFTRSALASLGLLAAFAAVPVSTASAQARPGTNSNLWHDVPAARLQSTNSPFAGRLTAYRAIDAAQVDIAAVLAAAPLEGTAGQAVVLTLPAPDGSLARFQVVEAPIMESALAAQFPDIKTYAGIGIDDPTATLRADLTPRGFHAQVLSRVPGKTFYIDPMNPAAPAQGLVSYWRQDLQPSAGQAARAGCAGVMPLNTLPASQRPGAAGPIQTTGTGQRVSTSLGGTLRTYRLALAATGEYTAFTGGTTSTALAAMTTSVNRVTGVYEKELGVRLVLVANTNLLIFTNASTDPYTNNDGTAMLTQNQARVDAVIGSANYDIGHVFSTGGGGIAGLGVVCVAGQKAQGVTGSPSPVADAFDIDYVAHEMGHQFGGNHPFNGSTGSCTGANRNASTAWEPGSGSTIMAYAGICDGSGTGGTGTSQDLQPHSDAYFHGGNISEMTTFINSTTCATSASSGNTPPTVSTPVNKSIPASTPFKLTASATDADADALTYDWEEMDLGAQGAPIKSTTTQTANATPPLFRSWLPTTDPTRYFPRLTDLRNNTYTYGEMLPTVARTMKFRVTVRDQHFSTALNRIVGGINQSNTVTLTVVNTGAAFAVTAPNTAVSLTGGAATTVTWNVASTSTTPISCATVNIKLSTDGGLTFPTTLASGVANSGSASVTIPNTASTTARIMVEAADNYFFDISNANFTITASSGAAPTVTSFSPTSGPVGTSVSITGTNFTGATSVKFNGTSATTFTVNSATSITATVPTGATTGTVSVTTASGTGTSASSFTVSASAPAVTSFSPTSGPVGTSVSITGTNFTGATSVKFNGTSATTFTVNSATSITATVPTGATTGTVSVTTAGGTGTSASSFTVTTSGGGTTATIVNYDFNAGTTYATLVPVTASGVTATASSTEAFTTFGGVATTATAFTTNSTAGNALAMANSSGTNTRYFQFALGGASLANYGSYKLYVQSQRSSTGAATMTLSYSTNGTTFTTVSPTATVPTTFGAQSWDLSTVTALNNQASVTFRLAASGASGTGTLRIDNFQVRATSSVRPLGVAADVTSSFTLWPNPAHNTVRVQGAAVGAAVMVYDLTGREVLRTAANAEGEVTLNLPTLRAGVYMVRTGAHSQRLVVE